MTALSSYSGSLEVELMGASGFAVAAKPALPRAAFEFLRSLHGAQAQGKGYSRLHFPARSFREVKRRLQECSESSKAGCTLSLPPKWVLAAMHAYRAHGEVKVKKRVAHVLLSDFQTEGLPEPFCSREGNPLLPYQREAVNFALKRGGRVLLADEMGLGKTAQALTLVAQYPQDWPVLVICPPSLRGNWRDEASKWLPADCLPCPDRHIQTIFKGSEEMREDARFFIVSYDLAVRNPAFTRTPQGGEFRVIIADEAHFLKNTTSQRSQALVPVLQKARRCALLSGTPALAKATELYNTLDALLPGLLPHSRVFNERYCESKMVYTGGRRPTKQWVGSRLGWELGALLESTVMIRRYKKDVLAQLPAKRRQRVMLDKLTGDAAKELSAKMKEAGGREAVMSAMEESGGSSSSSSSSGGSRGSAMELFKLTGLAKMEAVQDYVEYLVWADCKFLLFGHHKAMLDAMQERVEKLKTGFIRIDGSTPALQRDQLVQDFRNNDQKQVAILSITACGTGLNLQSCSTVVFAELHWTPGVLMQAEDRAHRMGQKQSVNVHYLIGKDTLDESMYQLLERKCQDVGVLLDGQASKLGASQATGRVGEFSTAEGDQVGGSNANLKAPPQPQPQTQQPQQQMKQLLLSDQLREKQKQEQQQQASQPILQQQQGQKQEQHPPQQQQLQQLADDPVVDLDPVEVLSQ
eukprot:TRINITY_DN6804_c0_g1_i1.p1 TRINITY_DN6804_c0_g1~~TRINITY_DN6804_c0_g1_i1.p1  ORF type:complete len:694 (-),score=168.26 TRINITY_DN6804_c0_g1_i1:152-2233(-)